MELIRTWYKYKASKGFTHSLRAQAIFKGLFGCENYHDVEIGFDKEEGNSMGGDVPEWPLVGIKGESQDLLSYRCILSICYTDSLDEWKLRLHPILAEKSKKTKTFLVKIGLPIIKDWLDIPKAETWFTGYRYLQIGLDADLLSYCTLETRNDRIIDKKIAQIVY
ncbi:MAG: hypothetical protein AAF696_22565 [Bacteroidota bacterium]